MFVIEVKLPDEKSAVENTTFLASKGKQILRFASKEEAESRCDVLKRIMPKISLAVLTAEEAIQKGHSI